MFIFNSYCSSFTWKNNLNFKRNLNFFNFFYNYNNNVIHYSLLITSFSFIFYLFSSIFYKNNLNSVIYLDSFLLLFLSRKSPIRSN